MNTTTSEALRRVARLHPPQDSGARWREAEERAWAVAPHRSSPGDQPGSVIHRLRKALQGEVVAFHRTLLVRRQNGETSGDWQRWLVGVPLTLFPKRDHGFTRVDCAIEFTSQSGGDFRVLEALPLDKSDTLANAAMGAELQVEASTKVGAPLSVPVGCTVAQAAARVYGTGSARFDYRVKRATITAEVNAGTGALWRLDNPSRPEEVAAESQHLAVILEIPSDAGAIDAAGYVKAYSGVTWLSSAVEDLLANLGQAVSAFLKGGAPVEAYGEWSDIFAAGAIPVGSRAGG